MLNNKYKKQIFSCQVYKNIISNKTDDVKNCKHVPVLKNSAVFGAIRKHFQLRFINLDTRNNK